LYDIYLSDAKNYHAWSYRLWFIERFNLWKDELDFVNEELDDGQFTNNSIWSYRYFLNSKTKDFTKDHVSSELHYALN
jgi:protein farnesyltransferase/geranylgeranyltransferase type-1 subunit alpha